jgi:hypothetical protein
MIEGKKKKKKKTRVDTDLRKKTKSLPLFIVFNFGPLIFNSLQTTKLIYVL